MERIKIAIEERGELGSVGARRLRREGFIPAVVYSSDFGNRAIKLQEYTYRKRILGTNTTQLFQLKSEESALDGLAVLIKDVRREPIKEDVLHVDFFAVSEDHRLRVTVPVHLKGQSPAVKRGQGFLEQPTHEIEIECFPAAIPEELLLDISELDLGQSLHISDLSLPEGSDLKSDPAQAVVTVIAKSETPEEGKEEVSETPTES